MKATATANSNIALVKYWGKRNNELNLPNNSSISMSLNKLYTTTTVEFSNGIKTDSLIIDGKKASKEEIERTSKHLSIVRKLARKEIFARVESKNNFPKSAGLASSASGFAALSLAATKALDLHLDRKELSILARQGSGSASRSIEGGFVEWVKGSLEDGSDSYAKAIAPNDHWPELTMIVAVLTKKEKKTGSNAGMEKTPATSPFYKCWLDTVEQDLEKTKKAILEKNFSLLGKTAEMNCLKMHSTMLTTEPHLIYWEPETIKVIKEVLSLREQGTECYFTIDAGPQVKVLCMKKNSEKIKKYFSAMKEVKEIFVCTAGEGAKLTEKDLF
ncbi:MAG: diphosphomevalonate decarboxylase [archaeon]|nr:diphosphomevalonate decarboxylase [archaeon]